MNLIRYIKALLSARHIKRIKTELQSAYSKLEAYRQREELEKMYFYKVGNVEFRMVPVEGGTFMKGVNPDGSKFGESVEVTLESFLCGETPVTEELWEEVMGKDYYWWRGPRRPVCVNDWDKIQIFISKLNELTGKSFRLLTDAEWEYAAKGGNKTKAYLYSGSNCPEEIGWVDLSNGTYFNYYWNTPLDVKMFKPNELGIYDMTGNVWEFCETSNLQEDDYFKDGGHIIRGGDCDTIDPISNIYYICWPCGWRPFSEHYHNIGFRLALSKSENIRFHSHQCESDKQTKLEKDADINEYINGLLAKLAKAKDEIKAFEDKESENRRNAEEAVKLKDIDTRSRAKNEAKGIFQVNNVKFRMIPVEGRTITVEEKGESHNETIEGFMCGETLVTVELWETVMGDAEKMLGNDPENLTPQSPAEVNWVDTIAFLRALNAMTKKEFRILSHKEWAFVEQEGRDTIIIDPKRSDRLDIYDVHIVKSKPANKLGIYDMDTYEWSSDDVAFWKKNLRSTDPCDHCSYDMGFRLALSFPRK